MMEPWLESLLREKVDPDFVGAGENRLLARAYLRDLIRRGMIELRIDSEARVAFLFREMTETQAEMHILSDARGGGLLGALDRLRRAWPVRWSVIHMKTRNPQLQALAKRAARYGMVKSGSHRGVPVWSIARERPILRRRGNGDWRGFGLGF